MWIASSGYEINLAGASIQKSAEMIVLTSEKPTDENSLDNPTKVAPVTKTVEIAGPKFKMSFAPNSLTILRIPMN
jgi:alpha-N-arabinofuranosidase